MSLGSESKGDEDETQLEATSSKVGEDSGTNEDKQSPKPELSQDEKKLEEERGGKAAEVSSQTAAKDPVGGEQTAKDEQAEEDSTLVDEDTAK